MSKLPAFTGNELIAVLKKAGFVVKDNAQVTFW